MASGYPTGSPHDRYTDTVGTHKETSNTSTASNYSNPLSSV